MPCSTAAADDDDNNATADDDDDDARARALPLPHFMTTSGTVGARLGTSQRRRCFAVVGEYIHRGICTRMCIALLPSEDTYRKYRY